MKKELVIFSFLLILSIGFVSAVWWNPFSWFGDEVKMSSSVHFFPPLGECPGVGETVCVPGGGDVDSFKSLFGENSLCGPNGDIEPLGNMFAVWYCANFTCMPDEGYGLCWETPSPIIDCDGDGYPTCDVSDCDDSNGSIWQSVYKDEDGDGWTIEGDSLCAGSVIPTGYILVKSVPDDSDDKNASRGGKHPCIPVCKGMCGDDGCGGSCGSCPEGYKCREGKCECVPQCLGINPRMCGDDGCGGSCGSCPLGYICDGDGKCVCATSCDGKQCGTDGCGNSCGDCPRGEFCDSHQQCCKPKTCSDFSGKCGVQNDGCGGFINCNCPWGHHCNAGSCICYPTSCGINSCGKIDDGCGNQIDCGGCEEGQECKWGSCRDTCVPKTCSDFSSGSCSHHSDGCGGDLACGSCSSAFDSCCLTYPGPFHRPVVQCLGPGGCGSGSSLDVDAETNSHVRIIEGVEELVKNPMDFVDSENVIRNFIINWVKNSI